MIVGVDNDPAGYNCYSSIGIHSGEAFLLHAIVNGDTIENRGTLKGK